MATPAITSHTLRHSRGVGRGSGPTLAPSCTERLDKQERSESPGGRAHREKGKVLFERPHGRFAGVHTADPLATATDGARFAAGALGVGLEPAGECDRYDRLRPGLVSKETGAEGIHGTP